MNSRQYFLNCDDRYIEPLMVVVYSLLRHSQAVPTAVYVAHNQAFADRGCRERLDRVVKKFPFASVIYCNADALLSKHRAVFESKLNLWSPIIWAGPLVTDVIPGDVRGKLLYLDVDMLVNADLGPLFDIDLRSSELIGAAVIEGERARFSDMEALEWPKEAGHYYNNGVLLLDLDRYREQRITEKIVAWYAKYRDRSIRTDQDSQNAVFGAQTTPIPAKWNFNDALLYKAFLMHPFARKIRTHPRREVLEAITRPCIIHYINRKPWEFSHRPTRALYHQCMRELGLFKPGLDGSGLRQKAELAFYRLFHAAIRALAKAMLRFTGKN